jgi:hypothetical protein
MATWPTITQSGGGEWVVWGGGITNHEVFAFTLHRAPENVGALISEVTVFTNNAEAAGQTSYFVNLQAMQFNPQTWALTPANQAITGNFESNGV